MAPDEPSGVELDETDRGVLYLLQHDARRITTQEMADQLSVSASTVRNHIEQLEDVGVIRGYQPVIDYDKAGLQLYVELICSAPNATRDQRAQDARDVNGVISIRQVLNGTENIQIDAVGTDADDVARISDELAETGLEVVSTKIIKDTFSQPFNHFGQGIVEEDTNE